MKVKQLQIQKKEGVAAGFRAARRERQSSSAAFNPIELLTRSTERDHPQAKLKIGSPGDIYEQEADQTAERAMSMTEPVAQRQVEEEEEPIQAQPLAEQITPLVQRQPEDEEEPIQEKSLLQRQAEEEEEEPVQEKSLLQRQAEEDEEPVQEKSLLQRQAKEEEEPLQTKRSEASNPSVSGNIRDRIQSLKGSGRPLPESTRGFFEPRFGRDFSNVRVHTGSSAAQTAKAIQAKAFTVGNDVVFGSGQYSPDSAGGRRLMAHELTHVVQQKGKTGPVGQQKAHGLERVQLQRGTGTKKTIEGIAFEKDAKGRLILTGKILFDEMKKAYNTFLKSESRFSGPETVKSVMSILDTVFYDISQDATHKHERFAWGGLEFSAEEVNYIGVGLGFEHFHIFLHDWKVRRAMIIAWNLKEHGDISKFGEHFWADFAVISYSSVSG